MIMLLWNLKEAKEEKNILKKDKFKKGYTSENEKGKQK